MRLKKQKRNIIPILEEKKSKPFIESIKYLDRENWQKLFSCIDNYRDKLIISMLYDTGMRVGELTKVEIKDIAFQESFIRISAENTKTKFGRTIYVPQELLSNIRAFMKLNKIKNGRLFQLTTRRIQQLLKKYSKLAGVKATPHTLRHTHIVHSLLNKIPITAIKYASLIIRPKINPK